MVIVIGWFGRALEWHSRGQRFDPAYLHHLRRESSLGRSLENTMFSRLFALPESGFGAGGELSVRTAFYPLKPPFFRSFATKLQPNVGPECFGISGDSGAVKVSIAAGEHFLPDFAVIFRR